MKLCIYALAWLPNGQLFKISLVVRKVLKRWLISPSTWSFMAVSWSYNVSYSNACLPKSRRIMLSSFCEFCQLIPANGKKQFLQQKCQPCSYLFSQSKSYPFSSPGKHSKAALWSLAMLSRGTTLLQKHIVCSYPCSPNNINGDDGLHFLGSLSHNNKSSFPHLVNYYVCSCIQKNHNPAKRKQLNATG